jgi:phosphoribosylaminoimidazole-succinocarboxamide synthase
VCSSDLVSLISDNEMLVKTLEILQVEVVVRNVAAGSLSKRLGYPEGTVLSQTVVEFYYKNDDLGDPLINNYHAKVLGIADDEQLKVLETEALRVNDVLRGYLATRNLDLIDFKLEFGIHKGEIILGDEISPDTCRFWDMETKEKLDKDRFRRDMGGVEEAYQEIANRLCV